MNNSMPVTWCKFAVSDILPRAKTPTFGVLQQNYRQIHVAYDTHGFLGTAFDAIFASMTHSPCCFI